MPGAERDIFMRMRSVIILWAGLLLLVLGVVLPSCFAQAGEAELEIPVVFRARPEVLTADRESSDGWTMIGRFGKRTFSAQLSLPLEGRSPSGEVWSLRELSQRGNLQRAFLRVEAWELSEPSVSFLLWPQGDDSHIQQATLREGWNLWEVTELARVLIRRREPLSVRLQAADGGSGALDLAGCRLCLCFSLPEGAVSDRDLLIQDEDLLSSALAALPLEHWAARRYREITDAIVLAPWPETGVPYYFGGHSEEKVLRPFAPSQPSKYYKPSRYYLCGFDCSSFLRWAAEKAGYVPMDQLDQLILDREEAFPISRRDVSGWSQAFLPGDLLVIDHGTFHVGMILGTPRMFGLDAANSPELAGWLDAPLMLHCGEDPFVYDRFAEYISTLSYRLPITPPDGGVTVSLLVNALSDAPHLRTAPWKKDYGYFLAEGEPLTVYPLADCRKLAWTRPVLARGTEAE